MMTEHEPDFDDLEHLAACDACRDARHDAQIAARAVALAGADHVAPPDLESRLLAALDAQPLVPVPAPVPVPVPVPVSVRRPRWPYAAAGIFAVAAAGVFFLRPESPSSSHPGMTAAGTGQGAHVQRVERAAPSTSDPTAGLAISPPGASDFVRVAAGEPITAGSRIRTDASTRAWLTLDDGSTITLDQDTRIELGRSAREVTLTGGVLVADITHVSGAPAAAFVTPRGRIDVLGTRFRLTATDELTSVHVTRGKVALVASGGSVDVRAGEEGTVSDGAPEVMPVPALATEVSWAELAAEDLDPADATTSGLGALRAFRPGESRDKDWPLALATHRVTVHVVGPIARTEIVETFRNDADHDLEGVYQFPMPPDARIDGLSLDDQRGGFIEGAFVDSARGNKIWDGVIEQATPIKRKPPAEIIWVPGRWRDPALLEWQRGGRSELRIFPIPAHGSRTIKIAYTQVLAPHGRWRRYVYPLPHSADGSTVAEDFSVEVRVAQTAATDVRAAGYQAVRSPDGADTVVRIAEKSLVPRGDIVVEHRPAGNPELRAWTFAGDVATAPDEATAARKDAKKIGIDPAVVAAQRAIAADVRPAVVLAWKPELPRWRETSAHDYVIVVDSSQSMVGERRSRATELASTMIAEMDRRDRVQVLACDVECRDLPGGVQTPSATLASSARLWLASNQPAGASDLVGSLRAALLRAPREADREPWIVYIGDGFATTGFRRAADVEALISEAASASDAHVVTVGIGGDADATLLDAAARGGGGVYIPWVPGQRVATAALAVLGGTDGAALRDATIELPAGLTDVAPSRLPTIRAGEELLIGARLTKSDVRGDIIVRGTVAGQPWEQRYPVALTASTAPGNSFVPRLWASLAIDELDRAGTGVDRAHIVGMSQAYGVLSRQTSLLVLESDAMFQAFGVERSRPVPTWTGSDALDEVASTGVLAYADDSGADRTSADGDAGAPMTTTRAPMPARKAKKDAPQKEPKMKSPPRPDFEDDDMEPLSDPFGGRGGTRATRRGGGGGGGGGMWMRRVYYRVGGVGSYDGVSPSITQAIASAESALAQQPDSRERHRALLQALAYGGELDRATEVAAAWLDRDQLDPQALVYLADLLGRQGRRDDAVRTLTGIVDLSPDDTELQARLATALDRAGLSARACGHRVALASILAKDTAAAGAAIRCLRALGRDGDATRISRALPDDAARAKAQQAAGTPRAADRVSGDLTVTARWTGGADLDLSIVNPRGQRLSWLGGGKGVAAVDAGAIGTERLGLAKARKGKYLIEISRTRAGDTTPVSGTIDIKVLGVTRSLPFRLDGDHLVVGRVAVTMQSRLVPY